MFRPISFAGKFFKFYLLFPSHPAKIRIENMLGRILFSKGIAIKDEEGVIFKLDANDWITRTMIEQGCYEPASIDLGKKIVEAGGVFVDIGANFGLYSCILGVKNNSLKIYSIEPNYKVLPRLAANITGNHLKEQAHIINAAVSEKSQLVFLELPEKNNLGTTVTSAINKSSLSILSCTLEYILEANHLSQIDILKIDIEGNEFTVLKDFPFDKYVIKNIILEFNHLSGVSFLQLQQFFESKGFIFFTITGEKIETETKDIPENNIWIINKDFI